ncbi:unnamed protein product [Miscanthus lutarioriparius]|uniref:Uncharacterized protein n=1 Tax=Miscanthus lutarioriparius TaxID=422564 RepID=A0A811QXM0_9POAL|nr:unnamed protein product [Miscanthus lutarioriparius]
MLPPLALVMKWRRVYMTALLRRRQARRPSIRLPPPLMKGGFVDAALQGLGGPATTDSPDVELMPNVLGDESSGYDGGGDLVGDRVASEGRSRPMKAPLVEESEDESEDGDLTKSMGVSLDGEISVPPGVDLARVGLGAPLKASLLPGAASPSGDSGVGAEGNSADTLSGWAECLSALYKEIGGRACHHLKKVNFYQLLRYNLEQQCLATQEVVNSNVALEALQAKSEKVEAEKKQLAEEVVGLRSGQKDLDELKGKIESLSKALDGSKAAEQLALDCGQKANDAAASLRKEVDAERESSHALGAQVELLTKRLEEAIVIGLSAAELYVNALGEFATNLSKTLIKSGYGHVEALKDRKDFESPADLGETSGNLTKAMRSFMKSFWLRFGCANARSLAEARHAADLKKAQARRVAVEAQISQSQRVPNQEATPAAGVEKTPEV